MSYKAFSIVPVLKSSTLAAAAGEAMRGIDGPSSHAASLGIIGFVIMFVLMILALVALLLVSMWKVYQKAGVPGWASLVPFYNQIKLLEITNRPYWWIFMFFIPVVNIFFIIKVQYRLAQAFGKGKWFTVGLICLPFIFFPILAFGNSEYSNTFPERPEMTESVKYSLAAMTVLMIGMIFLNNSNNTQVTHPLTILSSSGYATDGYYVYYDDVVVPNADVDSFEVINNSQGYDAQDKDHFYIEGELVPTN